MSLRSHIERAGSRDQRTNCELFKFPTVYKRASAIGPASDILESRYFSVAHGGMEKSYRVVRL